MPTTSQPTNELRSRADGDGRGPSAVSGGGVGAFGTPIDLPLLLGALRFGALVVMVLAGGVWLSGLLPAELTRYAALGLVASLGAAVVALWLDARFLEARATSDGRLMAGRLQGLLATAFGAKLAVLVFGMLGLRVAGVKFAAMAAFCVTFAAVSLICQVAIAGYLSRHLSQRPVPRSKATLDHGGSTPSGSDPTP